MPVVISRAEAKAQGLKRYFTGQPCARGHIAERSTANFTCFECKRVADAGQYQANPERRKVAVRAYAAKNRERIRQRTADYYTQHKAEIIARKEQWRKDRPEHVRAKARQYAAVRRARFNGAPGEFSLADVQSIAAKQQGICATCGTPLSAGFEVDHIIPLSRGGSNYPSNIQLLCRSCNRSKGAKMPSEWRRA